MKKKLVVAAMMACFGAALFASGGGEASKTGAAGAALDKNAQAKLVYWSHNGPAFVEATKTIIEKFKKEYPNVVIEYESFPYDVTQQKMQASYAAKQEPDIIQGFGAWMLPYMKKGLLAEVPASMSKGIKDRFYAAAIDGYSYQGKYYGMPKEVNVEYGIFYYPEALKKAGVTAIPKSFADFRKLAAKMAEFDSAGVMTKAGFDFYNSDDNFFITLDWILQQGGKYFAADGVHLDLTTPEAEKVLQTFVEMGTVDKITDIKRITPQDAIEQLFYKGRSASMFKGPWAVGLAGEFGVTDYAYAVAPRFAGTKDVFVCEPGWGEVVSARSQNQVAAWTFVDYTVNTENSRLFNLKTGTIPAVKAIAEDQGFVNDPMNAKIKVAFPMMSGAVTCGPLMDTDFIKSTLMKYYGRAIEGKLSAKDALAGAEDEINKHIDELLLQ